MSDEKEMSVAPPIEETTAAPSGSVKEAAAATDATVAAKTSTDEAGEQENGVASEAGE